MAGPEARLIATELVERFGQRAAVDGISLSVSPGEVYGLLGPNGAGKTTTIKMICGLLEPDHGAITVGGRVAGRLDAKRLIGYVPQDIAPRRGGSWNRGWTGSVATVMTIYDYTVSSLDGAPLDLADLKGKATLVVNVASKCGLTPQYEALEQLHEQYRERGFTVLGVPCNQFAGQDPGTSEEIATFCSTTYGVTFPLTEKLDVNGAKRHPMFSELTAQPDAAGDAGDIKWNFEKFLVGPDGDVVARFRPQVTPDSPEVVSAVEAALPA